MYPVDRSEMSAARAQMMARRRRSLTVLIGATVLFTLLALTAGGVFWLPELLCLSGVGGYVFFLRSQAVRDRERRATRQQHAAAHRPADYDATEEIGRFDIAPDSVVRIDDDDLELHNMDTIDLTGLYSEDASEPAAQRRAS